MCHSTPTQLRFPAIAGFTVRADFNGGALSSDFGAILLQGVDRQTGLIERLASAIEDWRHPSYIDHSLTDLLRQRIFQSACGYADGNDANSLRHDPAFRPDLLKLFAASRHNLVESLICRVSVGVWLGFHHSLVLTRSKL